MVRRVTLSAIRIGMLVVLAAIASAQEPHAKEHKKVCNVSLTDGQKPKECPHMKPGARVAITVKGGEVTHGDLNRKEACNWGAVVDLLYTGEKGTIEEKNLFTSGDHDLACTDNPKKLLTIADNDPLLTRVPRKHGNVTVQLRLTRCKYQWNTPDNPPCQMSPKASADVSIFQMGD